MGYSMIVGLGNPGDRYLQTRHNAGFLAVDAFARKNRCPAWRTRKLYAYTQKSFSGRSLKIVKPLTFMNLSGRAVKQAADVYEIAPLKIIVVHDDLDLDCGRIKVKVDGGTGGHKGLESILAELGAASFARVRIGIGHPGSADDVMDYVLQEPVSMQEKQSFEQGIQKAVDALETMIFNGAVLAMNRYNKADNHLTTDDSEVSDPGNPVNERGNCSENLRNYLHP